MTVQTNHKTLLTIVLGITQMLAWASTYYLPAMIAQPMASELGIPVAWVFAAFSLALLLSAFVTPITGRRIDRVGGRPVLLQSSLFFMTGLLLLSSAKGIMVVGLGFGLIGLGMGHGMYDSAFATLTRFYGKQARSAIMGVTLLGGLASTVGWPLMSWVLHYWGWQQVCLMWALLHMILGMPLHLLVPSINHETQVETGVLQETGTEPLQVENQAGRSQGSKRILWQMMLLSYVFAVAWFISTSLAAHFPELIVLAGYGLSVAVMAGALIGPAQVGARLFEFFFLGKVHPVLVAVFAASLHPVGAVLFLFFNGSPNLFAILHGAGNGMLTIAMGTVPLALFGPTNYGQRLGLIAMPARIVQSFSPLVFAFLLAQWGAYSLIFTTGLLLTAIVSLLSIYYFGVRNEHA